MAKFFASMLILLFTFCSWAEFDFAKSRENFSQSVNNAVIATKKQIESTIQLGRFGKNNTRQQEFAEFLRGQSNNFLKKNSSKIIKHFNEFATSFEKREINGKLFKTTKALARVRSLEKTLHDIRVHERREFLSSFYNQQEDLQNKYTIKKRIFKKLINKVMSVFPDYSDKYDDIICKSLYNELKIISQPYREKAKYAEIEMLFKKTISEDESHLDTQKCTICLNDFSEHNPSVRLAGCTSHSENYCLLCLNTHLELRCKDAKSLTCPGHNCGVVATLGDLQTSFPFRLAVEMKRIDLKSRQSSFDSEKPYKICDQRGCRGAVVRGKKPKVTCPECRAVSCLDCGLNKPIGNNCKEHRTANETRAFLEPLIKADVVQICRHCGAGVVRTVGCPIVGCVCGARINYQGTFHDTDEDWAKVRRELKEVPQKPYVDQP